MLTLTSLFYRLILIISLRPLVEKVARSRGRRSQVNAHRCECYTMRPFVTAVDVPMLTRLPTHLHHCLPPQITLETLVSFVVILLGIALTAKPLKNVTWASEMRTKYVHSVA